MNHKTAILAVTKKKLEYFGLVNILGSDNIVKQEHIKLPDDWFEFQAVQGFKQQVDDAAKSGKFVKVNYFTDRTTNDQVVRIKFVRNKDEPDQSEFVGMNVKGEEFTYSIEEAKDQFPQSLINEAMRKANMSKRKYLSIPPGDVKERDMVIGEWEIQFKQMNHDLCLPLSLANALFKDGLIESATALFSAAWTQGTRMKWGTLNQLIRKLCPHLEIVVKKRFSLDEFYEDCSNNMYMVVSILDSSGNESHAITVSDNLIFDSNEVYALPLCQANLDRCVSSNLFDATACSIAYGLCLHPRNNILKMENRVFLSLIWIFQKTGMFDLANETREYFQSLSIRRLAEADYFKFPSKQINFFVEETNYEGKVPQTNEEEFPT